MNLFNPFNSKSQKLISLLSKARVNFSYDKPGVKKRLLADIEEQQMSLAEKKIRELTHKSYLRRHKFATVFTFLLLVVVGSGAALAQADISKPGDRFHAMDIFGERLLLKLPMSETQKAELHTRYVDERNKELDYLLSNKKSTSPIKTQAVRDSQKSLDEAIEASRTLKENLERRGKTQQSEKIDNVLIKLEALAEQQEKMVNELRKYENDTEVKKELDKQIEAIKKTRNRVKSSK